MLRRGTIIIDNHDPFVRWCEVDRWTPPMRRAAMPRMDAKRRRFIWHKSQVGRAVHVPAGYRA